VTRTPTTIGGRTFRWGERTFVMGIVNATPDSFSGDGLLATPDPIEAAVAQARRMVDEGADLLDVGGESTRPGHDRVTATEEARRVVPIVRAISAALPGTPISIDTTKPDVAAAALDAGASLLNDIWGVGDDPGMRQLAAQRGVPIVLMHNREEAHYDDLLGEIVADLERAVGRAIQAGVAPGNILVDPGFGFGKSPEDNLEVLRELTRLGHLGLPVLLGTSRKSTLGLVLDLPLEDRLEATIATTVLGIAAGVDLVRVHDVRANVRAARMADAIVRRTWPSPPPERDPAPEGGPS